MLNEQQFLTYFWLVLAGVFAGGGLATFIGWQSKKHHEEKNAVPDVPRPDAIVTLLYFANGSVEVKATDAMGYPVPELVRQDAIDRVIEGAGYMKMYKRPVQAVCEASTVLEPVSVTVEELVEESPLDAVYPKTVEEAIDRMKAKGGKNAKTPSS